MNILSSSHLFSYPTVRSALATGRRWSASRRGLQGSGGGRRGGVGHLRRQVGVSKPTNQVRMGDKEIAKK